MILTPSVQVTMVALDKIWRHINDLYILFYVNFGLLFCIKNSLVRKGSHLKKVLPSQFQEERPPSLALLSEKERTELLSSLYE